MRSSILSWVFFPRVTPAVLGLPWMVNLGKSSNLWRFSPSTYLQEAMWDIFSCTWVQDCAPLKWVISWFFKCFANTKCKPYTRDLLSLSTLWYRRYRGTTREVMLVATVYTIQKEAGFFFSFFRIDDLPSFTRVINICRSSRQARTSAGWNHLGPLNLVIPSGYSKPTLHN
jgi:hypothetical protein